jgi:hypothetical protein
MNLISREIYLRPAAANFPMDRLEFPWHRKIALVIEEAQQEAA